MHGEGDPVGGETVLPFFFLFFLGLSPSLFLGVHTFNLYCNYVGFFFFVSFENFLKN